MFSDAGLISPYAAESMSWAVERGMIRGNDDGTADPRGNATRAQVAQIMMNYLTK
ncbi:MAG: S-layer homology domain-containing protein [Oscillospiraceae bacterium]|nr:S-layer homology domain-containing protein [Oscillospiraceae bacterium]